MLCRFCKSDKERGFHWGAIQTVDFAGFEVELEPLGTDVFSQTSPNKRDVASESGFGPNKCS